VQKKVILTSGFKKIANFFVKVDKNGYHNIDPCTDRFFVSKRILKNWREKRLAAADVCKQAVTETSFGWGNT
jgi:hypothetical protein